ncbi:hypothetical protein TRFO_24316 [Tritrichomonas foetus]|uniref:Uncharacterized protein n=1 Tax=Tritrichomonas foetus TaxID=1144522 RepID=A0A1J4K7S0_9EUKA|nr:hypothetical protein TRFO_24316 [Tritrichomonas foetus]|eukprot:OHT07431.1 hypothetical protein TRFO_24316 [Tritrichomonas foetus]
MSNSNSLYSIVSQIMAMEPTLRDRELDQLRLRSQESQKNSEISKNEQKVDIFIQANEEISNIRKVYQKEDEMISKSEEIQNEMNSIYSFVHENSETLNKIKITSNKKKFLQSLNLLPIIPDEILSKINSDKPESRNFAEATKLLFKFLKIIDDPKHNCEIVKLSKQNFQGKLEEMILRTKYSIFLRNEESEAIQAVSFLMTLNIFGYYNGNHDTNMRNQFKSPIDVFSEILKKWEIDMCVLSFNSDICEIYNKFIEIGRKVLAMKYGIDGFLKQISYFDSIKIEKAAEKFYLAVYQKFCNFNNQNSYFLKSDDIFDYETLFQEGNIERMIDETEESWGTIFKESSLSNIHNNTNVYSYDEYIPINHVVLIKHLSKMFHLSCDGISNEESKKIIHQINQEFELIQINQHQKMPNLSFNLIEIKNFFPFISFSFENIEQTMNIGVNISLCIKDYCKDISNEIINLFIPKIISCFSHHLIQHYNQYQQFSTSINDMENKLKNVYQNRMKKEFGGLCSQFLVETIINRIFKQALDEIIINNQAKTLSQAEYKVMKGLVDECCQYTINLSKDLSHKAYLDSKFGVYYQELNRKFISNVV